MCGPMMTTTSSSHCCAVSDSLNSITCLCNLGRSSEQSMQRFIWRDMEKYEDMEEMWRDRERYEEIEVLVMSVCWVAVHAIVCGYIVYILIDLRDGGILDIRLDLQGKRKRVRERVRVRVRVRHKVHVTNKYKEVHTYGVHARQKSKSSSLFTSPLSRIFLENSFSIQETLRIGSTRKILYTRTQRKKAKRGRVERDSTTHLMKPTTSSMIFCWVGSKVSPKKPTHWNLHMYGNEVRSWGGEEVRMWGGEYLCGSSGRRSSTSERNMDSSSAGNFLASPVKSVRNVTRQMPEECSFHREKEVNQVKLGGKERNIMEKEREGKERKGRERKIEGRGIPSV